MMIDFSINVERPTLIKFNISTGFPYLLTRFSKWSLVASYLGSLLDTGNRKKSQQNINRTQKAKRIKCAQIIHIMSGLRFNREVSWDQKRGIEPRFCTTELICIEHPSGASSKTNCSVSTSLATLPFSLTPRFRYLLQKIVRQSQSYG
jgi:hypothetical protein